MKKIFVICIGAIAALSIAAATAIAAPPDDAGSSSEGPFPYTEPVPSGVRAGADGSAAASSVRARRGGPVARSAGKRSRSFQTGLGDPRYSGDVGLQSSLFNQTAVAGADVVRIDAKWRSIAPSSRSAGFQATNPASRGYDWGALDSAVRNAHNRGLQVVLLIQGGAPDWAEGAGRPADYYPKEKGYPGTWKPNPGDVADFGTAVAKRYSGTFRGLPRVRDYLLWNEPTIPTWLGPQWKGKNGKKPASPNIYRKMLNAFYPAVKRVNPRNRVITAGTPPYGSGDPGSFSMRPLLFWRELLCMKGNGRKAKRRCPGKRKPKFDVLAHHPINTSGGPTRAALHPDDIATPDLHKLVSLLRNAERRRTTGTRGRHPVWATEMWWESNPPDKAKGTPSLRRQAAYYTEAFYLLWKQGASMSLTYLIQDERQYGGDGICAGCAFQSGLYFVDGSPKPSVRAMQFPFVADRKSKKKVLLWGKAPESGKLKVTQRGKGRRRVASFRVRAGKLFTKRVRLKKTRGKHKVKAKVNGTKALNWKVK